MEASSSRGRVSSSSQLGSSRTPASVLATISPLAAAMASFRPWDILQPSLPSVEPPSTITTSEGMTVCSVRESSSVPMEEASFLTVTMTDMSRRLTVLFD